ncbi:ketoacyl-synthetase C-terminal extension domain-containing protein, partial [Streptomyces axinellae]|uniref:CurL C-terminal domain-containing protein n=1 Tax=Streptomyces axinellae TaxID=552788 RepID=UPI0031D55CD6
MTGDENWPHTGHPRRAAVSSFGISGTNAHIILEAPPETPTEEHPEPSNLPVLLSGKNEPALRQQASQLATFISAHPESDIAEIARTLATSRTHHPHRAGIVSQEREEVLTALHALAQGEESPAVVQGVATEPGKIAFLYPGQGSQRPGMGSQLYETHPVFAHKLDEICAHFDPHLPHPLRDIMFAPHNH